MNDAHTETTPTHFIPTDEAQHLHKLYPVFAAGQFVFSLAIAAYALIISGQSVLSDLEKIDVLTTSDTMASGLIGQLSLARLITIVVVLLLIALFVGYGVLIYRMTTFVFTEREFRYQSGILIKKHVSIPYEKIQSVNQSQSIMMRVFGLCKVSIETAGGSTNKNVTLFCVSLKTAEHIRYEVTLRQTLLRKAHIRTITSAAPAANIAAQATAASTAQAGTPASAPATTQNPASSTPLGSVFDESTTQKPLSPAELARLRAEGSTNQSTTADILDELGSFRGIFGGDEAHEKTTYEHKLTRTEYILATTESLAKVLIIALVGAIGVFPSFNMNDLGGVALIGIVIAVFPIIGNVINNFFSLGGFTVRRRGNRIEVESGLLRRAMNGVSIDRIQFVRVEQTFIKRLLGYAQISVGRVESATQQMSENSGSMALRSENGVVLHPFIKQGAVDAFLENVLPELHERPADESYSRMRPVVLRRSITRSILWVPIALIGSFGIVAFYQFLLSVDAEFYEIMHEPLASMIIQTCVIVAILVFVYALIGSVYSAVRYARLSGVARVGQLIYIKRGTMGIQHTWLLKQKIQSLSQIQNPLQRHARVATMRIQTAAGIGHTNITLRDLSNEDMKSCLQWFTPGK